MGREPKYFGEAQDTFNDLQGWFLGRLKPEIDKLLEGADRPEVEPIVTGWMAEVEKRLANVADPLERLTATVNRLSNPTRSALTRERQSAGARGLGD